MGSTHSNHKAQFTLGKLLIAVATACVAALVARWRLETIQKQSAISQVKAAGGVVTCRARSSRLVPADVFCVRPQIDKISFGTGFELGGASPPQSNDIVKSLLAFPELTTLSLHGKDINQASIRLLTRMPHLSHLTLQMPQLDDNALALLAEIHGLKFLRLYGGDYTHDAMSELIFLKKDCGFAFVMTPNCNGKYYWYVGAKAGSDHVKVLQGEQRKQLSRKEFYEMRGDLSKGNKSAVRNLRRQTIVLP